MNLLQLEYFMALAKYRSFRKAAEALYVSQPAVSKQISMLEKELGLLLFTRDYRLVTLTPAGQTILEALQKSSELFQQALGEAKRLSGNQTQLLRLGLSENSSFGNLFQIIEDVQAAHPGLAVSIELRPISQLELQYPDGGYDLIVNHEYSFKNKPLIESRLLGTGRHLALISPRHPLAQRAELKFCDLATERFYVPATASSAFTLDYCAHICSICGFTPREFMALPNIESVLLAVRQGLGVVLLDSTVRLPQDLRIIETGNSFRLLIAWHKYNRNPTIPMLAEEIVSRIRLED